VTLKPADWSWRAHATPIIPAPIIATFFDWRWVRSMVTDIFLS
jgi:hypothetical protein